MIPRSKREDQYRRRVARSAQYEHRIVIADDYTGACDVGVQFQKHGMRTAVAIAKPAFNELKVASGLLVYDTETRNKSERTAYRVVLDFCSSCKKAKAEIVYKKIDSTLRGNLGAELSALLDVFKQSAVIVCSAYPQYHRVILNNQLFVRGVPVGKTEFANDPLSPVKTSDIKALVSEQTTHRVGSIPLTTIRGGPERIRGAIRELRRKGIRIICADAEKRIDLRNIANSCQQLHVIPCGSAGLAEAVASTLPVTRRKIMVLSASTNEATLKELQRLANYPKTLLVKASAVNLGGNERNIELNRIRGLVENGLADHDLVIVCSALYDKDVNPRLRELVHVSREFRDPVSSGLAAAVSDFALEGYLDAIVLTGGEMAASFLKRIQTKGLRLEREILPGIPLGTVMSGRSMGLRIVTKAGGFGLRGSMGQIVEYLSSVS